MIDEYIPVLLACVIAFIALLQPTDERFYAGVAFAATGLVHIIVFMLWEMSAFEPVDGITYFVTAALMSVAAMEIMVRISKVVSTTISLYRVCLAEIAANVAGLYLWYHGMSPAINVWLFAALRTWAVVILIRKDKADDARGYEVNSRVGYLGLVFGARRSNSNTGA